MTEKNPRADVSIDIDLFPDIIEAIDGQINIMSARLRDNDIDVGDDLEKFYQNMPDGDAKYDVNRMIRMQAIANKLDDFLRSLDNDN